MNDSLPAENRYLPGELFPYATVFQLRDNVRIVWCGMQNGSDDYWNIVDTASNMYWSSEATWRSMPDDLDELNMVAGDSLWTLAQATHQARQQNWLPERFPGEHEQVLGTAFAK